MGRIVLLVGMIVLLSASLAGASEYVPGRTRDDGLYLPPHFRGTAQAVHAAEAWFDALARDGGGSEADKLTPATSAGLPPGPSLSQTRRP